jgi:hypothetical protein
MRPRHEAARHQRAPYRRRDARRCGLPMTRVGEVVTDVGRRLAISARVGLVLGLATVAQAQYAQNPSPMSDTTRPHPRVTESRPDGARATLTLGELYLSTSGISRRDATMPLVVHFHGASWLVERHVAKSAPHAALVTVNLGGGSSRYAAPFADPATFSSLLADAAQAATRLRGAQPGGLASPSRPSAPAMARCAPSSRNRATRHVSAP